jgi:hypothetical protein
MAVLVVLLVGIAIAVARPGDLGDDDDTAAPTPSTTTTEMTVAETTTSTTLAVTTTTTATGSSGVVGASTTTTPASGLGATGSGSAGSRNLANTGGEALLLPAMSLLGIALATRRLSYR